MAVWLAVSVQVGAGAVARAEADPAVSALAAATIFCHAGKAHGQHHRPLHRHLVDPAIVQASMAALQALAVLGGDAACLPAPAMARVGCAGLPEARAPPGHAAFAFLARGPPAST